MSDPSPYVYAYIDPGSGSILIQALVAGIAAVAVATRAYWHKLLGLFKRTRPDEDEDDGVARPGTDE